MQVDTMTMPAGTYYVGDLCYVLGDSRWDEVCAEIIVGDRCLDGVFEMADGVRFAIFGTAYGDGEYEDQFGRKYSVDAGSIGCVLTTAAGVDMSRGLGLGTVVTFDQPFTVRESGGHIHIGDVWIDTDPPYEEDAYEYEDEDEE